MTMTQAAWGREADRLEQIPLPEFSDEVFTYLPGESLAALGPKGSGKTTAMFHLMASAGDQNPQLKPVMFVMKPDRGPKYPGERRKTGDETVARLTRELGGRIIRDYPPRVPLPWEDPPRFDVLWPRHDLEDFEGTEVKLGHIFERAIRRMYARGGHIIGADELYSLCAELGLTKPVVTVQTKGRSMDTGLFGASQRPAHVPLWTYSSEHLLMWKDNDRNTRKRYGEVSATYDWAFVAGVVGALRPHRSLYIHTPTGNMCIVT